jgi:hypothetical protein
MISRRTAAMIDRVMGEALEGHVSTGERTAVNTHECRALWEDAQPDRVQMFLTEEEWNRGVYLVTFERPVLDSPWTLVEGSFVRRVRDGVTAVVRRLDIEDDTTVYAICIATVRS